MNRPGYWVGIDENGLGARLGPLLVTGALAEVDADGARFLSRKLPKSLRADLDDSKALVSCHNISLGEAWTRACLESIFPEETFRSPKDLLRVASLRPLKELQKICPPSTKAQCWTIGEEAFEASDEELERIRGHVETLRKRGVLLLGVSTSPLCTSRLNTLKAQGISRFSADLHEMEALSLSFREKTAGDLTVICGKVGGMGQYGRFFGPLSERLHNVLEEGQAISSYHFPKLGELHFVRDADASAPLVMLASLVGKYFRELFMRRIAHYYRADGDFSGNEESAIPSGYHDPVTSAFIADTTKTRRRLEIAQLCFERTREETQAKTPATRKKKTPTDPSAQGNLFS